MNVATFSLAPWRHRLATHDPKRPVRYRRGVCLTLIDSEGRRGEGDAAPLEGFSAETLDEAVRELNHWLPGLTGRSFEGSAEDVAALSGELKGSAARFAVQSALLELTAAAAQTSTVALLGGEASSNYARQAMVHGLLDAAQAVREGYPILKLKMGRQRLPRELELAGWIRDRYPDVRLRIDANEAWDRPTALQAVKALAELGVELAEQPIAADDVEGLAQLRGHGVAIGADEAARSMADVEVLARHQAADAVVLKPTLVGGVFATLDMARRAKQLGLRVVLTHTLESRAGYRALCAIAHALASDGLWGAGIDTARCFEASSREVAA